MKIANLFLYLSVNLKFNIMNTEELRLLRENNQMLKQILYYLQNSNNNNYGKDFLINVMANIAADDLQGNNGRR